MSENPMSSLRMIRILGLSGALSPFAMVVSLLVEADWRSGLAPCQIDAEAKVFRQIHRAQQLQRPAVCIDGQTLDRQQGTAALDAKQLRRGGVRQRGADGLCRFP